MLFFSNVYPGMQEISGFLRLRNADIHLFNQNDKKRTKIQNLFLVRQLTQKRI